MNLSEENLIHLKSVGWPHKVMKCYDVVLHLFLLFLISHLFAYLTAEVEWVFSDSQCIGPEDTVNLAYDCQKPLVLYITLKEDGTWKHSMDTPLYGIRVVVYSSFLLSSCLFFFAELLIKLDYLYFFLQISSK